jgi:hypothetical protein
MLSKIEEILTFFDTKGRNRKTLAPMSYRFFLPFWEAGGLSLSLRAHPF